MGRRVLVLDGQQTLTPVAAVRALAAAGWEVGLAGPRPGPTARSRAVASRHALPDAAQGAELFAAALADLLARHPYDVVLPSSDAELLALAEHRAALPVAVPVPPPDVVRRALDKAALADAAQRLGLRTPVTVPVDAVDPDDPRPFAVKPQLGAGRAPAGSGLPSGTLRVVGGREVRALAERFAAAGVPAVAQEVVEGDLVALVALRDPDGRTVVQLQQRALAVHPRGAGTSTRARVEPLDPELADGGSRLLDALGWRGLVQLQFLRPAGEPAALIDLNGRLYGSLALAVAAGVNLPALWAASALGDGGPAPGARVGTVYSATGRDLKQALRAPEGRARELASAVRGAPGAAHPLWDRRDPGPWLAWTAEVLGGWRRRGLAALSAGGARRSSGRPRSAAGRSAGRRAPRP